jgi:hypothetical protein
MKHAILDVVRSVNRHFLRNPGDLLRMAGHAVRLRTAIPLDAFRWLAENLLAGAYPRDIVIQARPPALGVAATVNVMGAELRGGASVFFDVVEFGPNTMRATIRLGDVEARALDPNSPVNQLISSGALDLNKPADLVTNFVPQKPKFLVSAVGDTFQLDFMQLRGLAENRALQRLLAALTPVVNISVVRTEGDMLIIQYAVSPLRVTESLAALRG